MNAISAASVGTAATDQTIPADRPIVRAAAGVALLGSGLVHFSVAPAQIIALLVVLAVLGTAELVFAVGVLSGRIPLNARAAVLASVPLGVWALLAFAAAVLGADTALPAGPMLAGASLNVLAALALAASVRFPHRTDTATRPWLFTTALVVGAALLPFIAVPAMSAAQYPSGDTPSMSQIHEHHH